MKLEITVKQKEERVIVNEDVNSYYFDRAYLVVTDTLGRKSWFKTSTVLSIQEL